MNFSAAKDILELPDDFTPETIKQNYRRLSLKFHPDKGGNDSDFVKITEAYRFLTKEPEPEPEPKETPKSYGLNLNDIFRSFINNNMVKNGVKSFFGFKREIKICLTPVEFLQGTTREIETTFKTQCTCDQTFCHRCRGFSFTGCKECMGSGILQQCNNCVNGFITHKKTVVIEIPKTSLNEIILENTVIKLELVDKKFFVKEQKLYYRYNITLKESLTGFVKTFKDPFGNQHIIKSNTIVKPNDGYHIEGSLYLLFNIIYPKQLLTQLKSIDF